MVTIAGRGLAVRMASATAIATPIEMTPGAQCTGLDTSICRPSANQSGGKKAAMKKVKA
jgi:hypothetical protein